MKKGRFAKMAASFLILLSFGTLALCQRPFFAGLKPIGYPEVTTEALADRFGEVDGTTQRLPVEANGDRDLVDRLSKLPIDKQPFWLINWQALEAHRQNPQTYPQKPNVFVDPIQNNFPGPNPQGSGNVNPSSGNFNPNSGNVNPNTGNFNPNSGNVNPNSGNFNPNSGKVKPNSGNVNPNTGNFNPNSGNVNTNPGNFNHNSGNVNPNFGNVSPSSGHTNSNAGSVASSDSGFISSNRFGVEEHPNNQDPIENAYTNYNSGNKNVKPTEQKKVNKVISKDVHNLYA